MCIRDSDITVLQGRGFLSSHIAEKKRGKFQNRYHVLRQRVSKSVVEKEGVVAVAVLMRVKVTSSSVAYVSRRERCVAAAKVLSEGGRRQILASTLPCLVLVRIQVRFQDTS